MNTLIWDLLVQRKDQGPTDIEGVSNWPASRTEGIQLAEVYRRLATPEHASMPDAVETYIAECKKLLERPGHNTH